MSPGSDLSSLVGDHYRSDPVSAGLSDVIRSLAPGDRLLGERDLAVTLGVSRTALRDRLRLMEGLGVLRRTTGSGTFVQDLDPTGLALALDIALSSSRIPLSALHTVRTAIERQAAIEAAGQQDPVLIAHMRKAVDTIAASTEDSEVDNADFHFHDTLLRASGNQALAFFASALGGVLHKSLHERRIEMRKIAGDREVMARVHRDIYDAVASGDSVAAAAAVEEHFATFDRLVLAAPKLTTPSQLTVTNSGSRKTGDPGGALSPD
ncbi:MAG: FadR/GntR family transcriptional regulator [Geodermatophilaceae bacterium]